VPNSNFSFAPTVVETFSLFRVEGPYLKDEIGSDG